MHIISWGSEQQVPDRVAPIQLKILSVAEATETVKASAPLVKPCTPPAITAAELPGAYQFLGNTQHQQDAQRFCCISCCCCRPQQEAQPTCRLQLHEGCTCQLWPGESSLSTSGSGHARELRFYKRASASEYSCKPGSSNGSSGRCSRQLCCSSNREAYQAEAQAGNQCIAKRRRRIQPA